MVDQIWKWKLHDKRTADRYLEKGLLSKDEWEKHLKSLPDDSANATWVEMNLEETDMSGDLIDEEVIDAEVDEAAEQAP